MFWLSSDDEILVIKSHFMQANNNINTFLLTSIIKIHLIKWTLNIF